VGALYWADDSLHGLRNLWLVQTMQGQKTDATDFIYAVLILPLERAVAARPHSVMAIL